LLSTIERSLEEKFHIEWQLHQLHNRQSQRQFSIGSEMNEFDNIDSRDLSNRQIMTPLSRQLEDAFEGLYTNTYGTNMFCGASWAEASSSCESRQNCPSGQNDECVIAGQQCWAFTECDTRYGHGEQFSEMHGVTGGANLEATGVGAEASGGYVDLSKPSNDPKDHYFCGKGYEDALSQCLTNCPSGSLNDCPDGEICFFNTPCDARMMTGAPQPPSPTVSPTTPAPVVYSSKLNKYYCGEFTHLYPSVVPTVGSNIFKLASHFRTRVALIIHTAGLKAMIGMTRKRLVSLSVCPSKEKQSRKLTTSKLFLCVCVVNRDARSGVQVEVMMIAQMVNCALHSQSVMPKI
jgi:hypothetical protein